MRVYYEPGDTTICNSLGRPPATEEMGGAEDEQSAADEGVVAPPDDADVEVGAVPPEVVANEYDADAHEASSHVGPEQMSGPRHTSRAACMALWTPSSTIYCRWPPEGCWCPNGPHGW